MPFGGGHFTSYVGLKFALLPDNPLALTMTATFMIKIFFVYFSNPLFQKFLCVPQHHHEGKFWSQVGSQILDKSLTQAIDLVSYFFYTKGYYQMLLKEGKQTKMKTR